MAEADVEVTATLPPSAPPPYIWHCAACGVACEGPVSAAPAGWVHLTGDGQPAEYFCSRDCAKHAPEPPAEAYPGPVLTARVGTNAPLFESILRLYVPERVRVLDMTYGKGNFWRMGGLAQRYSLVRMDAEVPGCDLHADFRSLPFRAGLFTAAVLDPPYANNGGQHSEASGIHRTYNLKPGLSSQGITALYRAGIAEAWRVLHGGGVVIIKCQNQVESGRMQWQVYRVFNALQETGFEPVQEFVLVRQGTPMMRHGYQHHARVNDSRFLVARKPAATFRRAAGGLPGQPALWRPEAGL
jgi:hypothetical protein